MMKGIIILGIVLLTAGCCCTTVQYRQVTVAPVAIAPVVEPVILSADYPGPLDVTTTTIDYY
ncbi:hypothetical protein [Legionella maioricensis]|uniref:Uncharacterized protein n=1 Tax=Legionella maioricensis TaxID=2896528 RepID=A0A9X2D1B9_9GAMM|nr:hypothetical protein [Legionella maioricensis]MCL9684805.1 hypothetical protein [Legionella maioricensis]MCL9687793.1 hypothetical protein [Legionella maioricensis]